MTPKTPQAPQQGDKDGPLDSLGKAIAEPLVEAARDSEEEEKQDDGRQAIRVPGSPAPTRGPTRH
jgi:hypothetical protein